MRCFSGRGIEDPELISDISDLGGKQAQNLVLGSNSIGSKRVTMSYPRPWLLYIFPDRGQDLERARSSAALNLWRVVHVFSADGPWATGGGLLRADFCRPASFFLRGRRARVSLLLMGTLPGV